MNRKVKVAQSCPTLCNPMDYYTVHGTLQARILEWVDFPFSRGSSQSRDQTQVSRIAGGFFTSWATRDTQEYWSGWPIPSPGDLSDPGIEPWSPALQVDSLPTELCGKPETHFKWFKCTISAESSNLDGRRPGLWFQLHCQLVGWHRASPFAIVGLSLHSRAIGSIRYLFFLLQIFSFSLPKSKMFFLFLKTFILPCLLWYINHNKIMNIE